MENDKDRLIQNFIGDIPKGVTTRHPLNKICNNVVFISQIKPKGIDEGIIDKHWFYAMQNELNQFK